MKQQDELKKPFFVNFLESQQRQERGNYTLTTRLGDGHQTHKYPSDSDEGGD